MDRYRNLYEALLDNGELLDLFPELKRKSKENNWELDKDKFTKLQKEQEDALNIHFEE